MKTEVDVFSMAEKIRETKPLVHHMTNWVTIYDCANITRAIGALPVMAHAPEEVEEMVGISSALVLNIGTLTPELIETMKIAGKAANKKGIPIVLDAVGVGATSLRTKSALGLLEEISISVVKGNRGEIGTLSGAKAEVRGVEAGKVEGSLQEITMKLAREKDCVAAMTGKEDFVARPDGKGFVVKNGHEKMGSIVGTGCMSASVIGSFCAVEKDYAKAAAAGLSYFEIAGELAARESKGPGTYKQAFYDEIYNLDKATVDRMQKVEEFTV